MTIYKHQLASFIISHKMKFLPRAVRFSPLLFAITTLFCAASFHVQARETTYIDVSAVYNIPSWENVKNGFGVGIALGNVLRERHHVEGELLYLRNDLDDGYNTLMQIPLLASYRYSIRLGTKSRWTLEAGGSAGAVQQYLPAESKWVAALGVQVKVVYRINNILSVNAGHRAILVAKANPESNSGINTMPTFNIRFNF